MPRARHDSQKASAALARLREAVAAEMVTWIGDERFRIGVPQSGNKWIWGEYAVPTEFVVIYDDSRQLSASVVMEVVVTLDGPQCMSVDVERRADGPPVSLAILRDIRVDALIKRALNMAAMQMVEPSDPTKVAQAELLQNKDQRRDFQRTMRTKGSYQPGAPVDDVLLREVARVWLHAKATTGHTTKAVMDRWGVSKSTAVRWRTGAEKFIRELEKEALDG